MYIYVCPTSSEVITARVFEKYASMPPGQTGSWARLKQPQGMRRINNINGKATKRWLCISHTLHTYTYRYIYVYTYIHTYIYLMVVIHNAAAVSMYIWQAIYCCVHQSAARRKPRTTDVGGSGDWDVVESQGLSCCDIKFNSKSFFFFRQGNVWKSYLIFNICLAAGWDWEMWRMSGGRYGIAI